MTTRTLVFTRRSRSTPAEKTHATAEARTKEGHYRTLPKEFRRDGFSYRQIAREGNAAIYEQTWNGCRNRNVSWEAIHIRCREGFRIGGRSVEPSEVYPNSEAWGADGFTFTDWNKCRWKNQQRQERR